jgi:hypothetical protein
MNRLGVLFALCVSTISFAGIMGVPINLNANGSTSGTTTNPPGWLFITGPNAPNDYGDVLHQSRYFVEVTGTTMDVRIFDPGSSGARDYAGGGNNTTTTFSVFLGATLLATVTQGDDNGTTEDRLVRLVPSGAFFALNSTNASNVNFSTLTPGLYEIRVATTGGDEGNFFGLDVRVSSTNPTHYNVYNAGSSSGLVSSFPSGSFNTGTPPAAIVQPEIVFPYVVSGCGLFSSNFDGDGNGTASLFDSNGSAAVSIPMSGSAAHTEATLSIESAAAQNVLMDNYGMWTLSLSPGATNVVDWRFSNFQEWSSNATGIPPDPFLATRIYLPNGYSVAPTKPKMNTSAAWVSGPNPPVVGSATVFTLTGSIKNPSAQALTNPAVTIGQPTGVSFVALTQACFINGVSTGCTDTSGAGFRRATVASLAAGSTFSMRINVTVTPAAAGLLNLTGVPAAPTAANNALATYTSAYAVAETLGPICNMVVQVGGATPLVTDATVDSIQLIGNHLSFTTSMQVGSTGFHVYASNDDSGKERVRLTKDMIISTQPDSHEPLKYETLVDARNWSRLFIEEYSISSEPKIVASISTKEARAVRVTPSIKAVVSSNAKASGVTTHTKRRSAAVISAVKIEVPEAGSVFVSNAQLQNAGMIVTWRSPKLYHQGELVPMTRTKQGYWFNSASVKTQYTGNAVYVLSTRALPKVTTELTRREVVPQGTTRIEKNRIYFAKTAFNSDPWFWALLRSDIEFNDPVLGQFDLRSIQSTALTVPVRLRFVSRSGHRHTVEAWLNQQSLGQISFDGDETIELESSVLVSQLRTTGNELRLKLTSVEDSRDDVGLGFVYFDRLEIDGLDLPPTPQVNAVSVAPYSDLLPSLAGVQYVVVSPAEFLLPAQQLASAKIASGMSALVVNVSRIYDRYSGGHFEAQAIAAFVHDAALAGVKYVVLLGDDTFDYRNFTGLNTVSQIPSLDGWDSEFGRVPSENRYADVNGDGLPDLAIGRLPAQTLAQATHLVQKAIQVSAVVPQTHLAIVDQRGANDSNFLQRAQNLNIGNMTIVDATVGSAAAKTQIDAALAQGQASIHYFGHGSPTGWSSQLWTAADSANTASKPPSGAAFQWACFSQWYQYLFEASLGESLLLMQGGPTASFGPAGISNPQEQQSLSDAVYAGFYVDNLTLGEAIVRAKRNLMSQSNGEQMRGVVEGWNLLGDPAQARTQNVNALNIAPIVVSPLSNGAP